MAKDFKDYFATKPVAGTDQRLDGDELLLLRSGQVFRVAAVTNQALAGMSDNAVVTIIAVQGEWTQIAGILISAGSTSNISFASNQYTFNGTNQTKQSRIAASISLTRPVAGPADDCEVAVVVNGVPVGITFELAADDAGYADATCGALHAMQSGDVMEIMVRNNSTINDLLIRDAILEIS